MKIKDNLQDWPEGRAVTCPSLYFHGLTRCLAQQKQSMFNGYPGILSYHNHNTSRHKTKLQKEIYFKSIREHLHLNKVITGVLQKKKKSWHEVFLSNF